MNEYLKTFLVKKHFLAKIVFLSFISIAAFGVPLIWTKNISAIAAPTTTISSNPSTITAGQSSIITWSSNGAVSCTGSSNPSGSWSTTQLSGSATVNPTVTTTYTLSCTGTGVTAGTSTSFTTVNVSAPPAGDLIISKVTTGGDGLFTFSVTGPSSIPNQIIQTAGGVGYATIPNITPGSYTVTEVTPLTAGWFNIGSNPQTAFVSNGSSAGVWFQNEAHGDLLITKEIIDPQGTNPGGSFYFNINGPSSNPGVTINIPAGETSGSALINNIIAGNYLVYEGPAGPIWNNGNPPPSQNVTVPINGSVTAGFTNQYTPQGILRINKMTFNGGDNIATSFTFNITGPNGYNHTETIPVLSHGSPSGMGMNFKEIPNLYPGNYTITEQNPPAGWVNQSVNPQTVYVYEQGQATDAWFYNQGQGNLTITKEINTNSGGLFSFTVNGPSSSNPTIDIPSGQATGSVPLNNINAGTYTITENLPPSGPGIPPSPWTLTNISCTGGQIISNTPPSIQVTINPGESANCTFTNQSNTTTTTLTLIKDVINTGGGTATASQWTLSATGPTPISGITGDQAITDRQVSPGAYTISESGGPTNYTTDPNQWTCSGTGATGNNILTYGNSITLSTGDQVTCSITNTYSAPQTTLTLVKTVNGGPALPEEWILEARNSSNQLIISGSPTQIIGPNSKSISQSVNADTYTLSENGGPAGYTATLWSCTGATSFTGNTVQIDSGQNVTCTITNNAKGILKITKETVNNVSGEFSFQLYDNSPQQQPFHTEVIKISPDVNNPAQVYLDQGNSYTIKENLPNDSWFLVSVICNGNQVPIININSTSNYVSNITIAIGQTTSCTFKNAKKAELIIKKVAFGGEAGDEFRYRALNQTTGDRYYPELTIDNNGDGESNPVTISSGIYSITELLSPQNNPNQQIWSVDSISCTVNHQSIDLRAGIIIGLDIQPGSTVTCTFTNTKKGKLRLIKYTFGGDNVFQFKITDSQSATRTVSLQTINNQRYTTILLAPGLYTIDEVNLPNGWHLVSNSCSQGFAMASDQPGVPPTVCKFVDSNNPSYSNAECVGNQCVQCQDPFNCPNNCQNVGDQCVPPVTKFSCVADMCMQDPNGTQTGCFFNFQGCTPQNTGWTCQNNQCQQSQTGTQIGCQATGQYCATNTGFSCLNNTCIPNPYGVQTGCFLLGTCTPQPTGWTCNNNQCQQDPNGTQTSCLNTGQFCATTTGWMCFNNQCIQDPNGSQTGCGQNGQQCTPQPTGFSCVGNMCTLDPSGIQTSCLTIGQSCLPQPTGLECQIVQGGYQCVTSPGGIQTGCQAGQSCTPQPTNWTCQNNQCVFTPGGTQTGCGLGLQCNPQPPPPTNWTCQNDQCVQIQGGTQTGCSFNNQTCIPQTGWSCVNLQCQLDPSGIQTGCSTNQACHPQPTGFVCVAVGGGPQCVVNPNGRAVGCQIAGQGCTPQPTGFKCENHTCVYDPNGTNTACNNVGDICDANTQCVNKTCQLCPAACCNSDCNTVGEACNPEPPPIPQPDPGILTINVETNGDDGTFNFSDGWAPYWGNTIPPITTSGGTGSTSVQIPLTHLVPNGPYYGWVNVFANHATNSQKFTLVSASCDHLGQDYLSVLPNYSSYYNNFYYYNQYLGVATSVESGQTTTCTFNYSSGGLKILVNTIGGGNGDFKYSVNHQGYQSPQDVFPTTISDGDVEITTSGGTGSEIVRPLSIDKKKYDIRLKTPSANQQDAFSLLSAECDDKTSYLHSDINNIQGIIISGITIPSGQVTTCTFTYGTWATLHITQNTIGGDGTFAYNIRPSYYGSGYLTPFYYNYYDGITTDNGTGSLGVKLPYLSSGQYNIDQRISYNIATGAHIISNNINGTKDKDPHWIFDSASCSQSYQSTEFGVSDLSLSYGQTIDCTFNNTWYKGDGYLNVIKNTTNNIDGKFDYSISGPESSKTSIKTSNGSGTSDQLNLTTGSYNVKEDDLDNWNVDSAACYPPHKPSTITDDASIGTVEWQDLSNAQDSDNDYAKAELNLDNTDSVESHYLKATGFGFNIPSEATIKGVEVYIEKKGRTQGGIIDNKVSLVKNDIVEPGNKSNGPWPTYKNSIVKYGSSNDLWGSSLTPSEINSGDFGVAISVKGSLATARIDEISMVVTYRTVNGTITVADGITPSTTQGTAEISSLKPTTCIFTNSPKGILEINMKYTGQDRLTRGVFDYNIYSIDSSPKTLSTIATIPAPIIGSTESYGIDNSIQVALAPGKYNILETGPISENISWTFNSASCVIPNKTSKNPSNASDDSNSSTIGDAIWQNPSSITSSDNVYASVSVSDTISSSYKTSHYLKATGFGFSIPADATVKGIEVDIERKATNSQNGKVVDNVISLIKNGNVSVFNKAHLLEFWPSEDSSTHYGNSSDSWNTTFTPNDINATNFGVAFSAGLIKISNQLTGSSNADIDNIKITVSYTTPGSETVHKEDKTIDTEILDWESTGRKTVCTFNIGSGNQCIDLPQQ